MQRCMKYGDRRALTSAEINPSVTRLLLTTFIDATLRAFPPSGIPLRRVKCTHK